MISKSQRMRLLAAITTAITIGVGACASPYSMFERNTSPLRIAFMPDVHFHDVYASLSDNVFIGPTDDNGSTNAFMRSMDSQLKSTRLFNESYFAFRAALDDVVSRDIDIVVLPGDFSDDGQPVHIRGLVSLLEQYAVEHGIRFFLSPGNHDPTRPFGQPSGEPDFLSRTGKEQPIFSRSSSRCPSTATGTGALESRHMQPPVICSEDVAEFGYEELIEELGAFGFLPDQRDVYWETPFSYGDARNYRYSAAKKNASLMARQHEICREGTGGRYKKESFSNCSLVPDASYVVEPVPGLWLLSIDANVYVPSPSATDSTTHFMSPSNAGWNRVVSHKAYLLDWMQSVAERARQNDKTLITFSHYPVIEFYDDQSDSMSAVFGQHAMQLQRRPSEATSEIIARTGIRLHVGGHMHMNDTAVRRYSDSSTLHSIQVPCLAAYVPAYKILTVQQGSTIEIETVVIDEVKRYSELFEHYITEHNYRAASGSKTWSRSILDAEDYRSFTSEHLRALVSARLMAEDWPPNLRDVMTNVNGTDMLIISQLKGDPTTSVSFSLVETIEKLRNSPDWKTATVSAQDAASRAKLNFDEFSAFTGVDLVVDFYRLRNAKQLALADISDVRLAQYDLLGSEFGKTVTGRGCRPNSRDAYPNDCFAILFEILKAFRSSPLTERVDVPPRDSS